MLSLLSVCVGVYTMIIYILIERAAEKTLTGGIETGVLFSDIKE
mgnify:CR=1 FL=1